MHVCAAPPLVASPALPFCVAAVGVDDRSAPAAPALWLAPSCAAPAFSVTRFIVTLGDPFTNAAMLFTSRAVPAGASSSKSCTPTAPVTAAIFSATPLVGCTWLGDDGTSVPHVPQSNAR